MLKDSNCGELRKEHAGRTVLLAGWVNRRRDHGGLIFVDLRDRSGLVQVVFNPQTTPEAHKLADRLRSEWVVRVRGSVAARPKGTENPKIPSGEVEVHAQEIAILGESKPPPFYVHEDEAVEEALRMRYRYVYLRRPRVVRNLTLRHQVVQHMRRFLDTRGFLEIETPILTKSTPEGARDYLVPSRLHPGSFYALPQSPQQLKQLLMVGGLERYYQMARCFRDEDLRADRQPEFTQLDLEMSFIDQEDILGLMEELFTGLVKAARPDKRIMTPFPRLTYRQAIDQYGTDKPDLRFGMLLGDLTSVLAGTGFQVFQQVVAQGGIIKGLAAPDCGGYSRKQLDDLAQLARDRGARGLVTIALRKGPESVDALTAADIQSLAVRHFSVDEVKEMARRLGAKPGDLLLLVAGAPPVVNAALGSLRQEMGKRLGLLDPDLMAWAFITDFALFEWSQEDGRWKAARHPFTAPLPEDEPLLESDPHRVRAQAYDLVCNGFELASGSIRIHTPELQERLLMALGYTPQEAQERFGHLLEAFSYGAPPHGGIACGVDRVVMLLADEESLREVIAFPKTQMGTDLLFGAPAPVRPEQLKEVHLKVLEEALAPPAPPVRPTGG
ncbi:MAG: aspartate--tRNA ligase [Dehalococcoidia bacterium]|nr:aspartate--tRNA ligase [Dehalococcoidia bacterium]